ncbi:unnamed protein product [Echinostoma caproni]|uniref:Uncharacterized protein n=1 Tax=Echinostoma caproni TaxID=27848 RepID=A0A183AVL7_9TREM|nr:unnamed protein product [Echinostoma caproni]
MSVLFSSGKKSAAVVRGTLKKKSSQGSDTQLPTNSYMPSVNVCVWNLTLENTPISLAYCRVSRSPRQRSELVMDEAALGWLNDRKSKQQQTNSETPLEIH